MRVSVEWLKEYVDVPESPAKLADRLTFSGIEVEGIESLGADLSGLVAAEVRAVTAHPNADRLVVCRVFDGTSERQVVCGAPNVRAGGRYPFAPLGAVLPDGTKIRPAQLRGVASEGMLCAEDELGLGDDHSELFVLSDTTRPGAPLNEVLGPPDTVLDLEITPNRPDCLSLLGIAREVAALYRLKMRRPRVELKEGDEPVSGKVSVTVETPEFCPRYMARVLDHPAPSADTPEWMRRRLAAAGLRSLHPVVDVTNYVLLECGHPLHAFDLDRLDGARIVVRNARAGERLKTLDGTDRELSPDMLVIADASNAVAIAGVMGGAGSEITSETRRILLESACFHPGSIRRTARRLNLHSESSHRFSRGTDPENADWASRRAAALIRELTGALPAAGAVDVRSAPSRSVTVPCRWEAFSRAMGTPVAADDIAAALKSLELEPIRRDAEGSEWQIPSFRGDLREEVDLIEEFVRIRGLDAISERAPSVRLIPGAGDRGLRAEVALKDRLAALGLTEILNYSLVSDRILDRFDPEHRDARVRLPHPLSEDQSVLRTALLPQMAETLGRNRSRQVATAACYEVGRVFRAAPDGLRETTRLSIGLMGAAGESLLTRRATTPPERRIQWLRGILDALCQAQRIADWAWTARDVQPFDTGWALRLDVAGKPAGFMGLLDPKTTADWRIFEPLALAELDVEPFLAQAHSIRPVNALPIVPCIRRDLAFVVDRTVRHEDVLSAVRKAARPELERIELFDIYEGRGIAKGRKSMAYAFTWRAANRTLTDDEVAGYDWAVREALIRECGAEIRDH